MSKPKRNNKGCPACKRLKELVETDPDDRNYQGLLMDHYKNAHKLYGKWYPK